MTVNTIARPCGSNAGRPTGRVPGTVPVIVDWPGPGQPQGLPVIGSCGHSLGAAHCQPCVTVVTTH